MTVFRHLYVYDGYEMMLHVTNQHMNILCTLCGENVGHQTTLSKHIEEKHVGIAMLSSNSPNPKKQRADPTPKAADQSMELIENIFECSECSVKFQSTSERDNHEDKEHPLNLI